MVAVPYIHCLLCYWYIMLLFQSASLQVPSSKSALVPAGVERKNPTSRNTNSSQCGSAHVAAGSGQTCELVAWPKLRS